MKIFSVQQIKKWDQYTIQHEPISSIDLMERAAMACFRWISNQFNENNRFFIFCGNGNNGGDGLAIARLLIENGYQVKVYLIEQKKASEDFSINLNRLHNISEDIYFLESAEFFPELKNTIVIDALFGTGLNKAPTGIISQLIHYINKNAQKIISIDIPSGLFADKPTSSSSVVKANFTLTFQCVKQAFLLKESAEYVGKLFVLPIGLSDEYEKLIQTNFELIDAKAIREIYRPRDSFSHKGNFGYACLIAGSYGMIGAAVLASKACIRSGVGKLQTFIPKCGYEILQSTAPEVMCTTFGKTFPENIKSDFKFDALGIGPGIGQHASHSNLLQSIFSKWNQPLVIDADALNTISDSPKLLESIPTNSILTPHPKEFERLFGKTETGFERIELALEKSQKHQIYIVLKGHFTFISTPEGKGFFNSTGNPGMATAGTGDVLTGILTGLMAQQYTSLQSCILGVYLHGLAGDAATQDIGEEALIAEDIINYLGKAFREISNDFSFNAN